MLSKVIVHPSVEKDRLHGEGEHGQLHPPRGKGAQSEEWGAYHVFAINGLWSDLA